MPVHSSLQASDTYDSLYYLAKFVVVSRHLAFEATRLRSFPSPFNTHLQDYPEDNFTTIYPIRDL